MAPHPAAIGRAQAAASGCASCLTLRRRGTTKDSRWIHGTAFALPALVAAVLCVVLLAVSVWGATTWARVDLDPVTVPWTGQDRHAGTRDGRLATFAVRIQPWAFVIMSAVWIACTAALHATVR